MEKAGRRKQKYDAVVCNASAAEYVVCNDTVAVGKGDIVLSYIHTAIIPYRVE